MFYKILLVCAIAAGLTMQGMKTTQLFVRSLRLDTRAVGLSALYDTIDQQLNSILGNEIDNQLRTITGLVSTVEVLKNEFLDNSITTIWNITIDVLNSINTKAQELANTSMDVRACIISKNDSIINLGNNLTAQVTSCVSEALTNALKMIAGDQKIVSNIINNSTNLSTDLLTALTKQITEIVSKDLNVLKNLTDNLPTCVQQVVNITNTELGGIFLEFGKCADELIP